MKQNKASEHQGAAAWEQLVTEGHVLAARLRATSVSVVSTGILLMFLGTCGLLYLQVGTSREVSVPSEFLREKIVDYKQSAQNNVKALSFQRELTDKDRQELAPSSQLPALVDAVLEELNKTGTLPKNIAVVDLAPKEFWNTRWSNEHSIDTVFRVSRKNVMALGALVNVGNETDPIVKQWVGLFKKQDDKWWGLLNWVSDNNKGRWLHATLETSALYSYGKLPSVLPQDIPVSIHELAE